MQASTDKHYKILLAGPSKTGKTSIVNSFLGESSKQTINSTTLTIQHHFKIVQVNGVNVNLQILDPLGLKKFQTITKQQFKGVNVILFVMDLTDVQSFLQLFLQILQMTLKDLYSYDCSAILVGNKKDLIQGKQVNSLSDFQQEINDTIGQYISVSAKTGQNVQLLFLQATKLRLQFDSQAQNVKSLYERIMQMLEQPQNAQYKEIFLKLQQQHTTAAPNGIKQIRPTTQLPMFQVFFVGSAKVGKTSIITQYAQHKFSDKYIPTDTFDLKIKDYSIDNAKYNVYFWDTADFSQFKVAANLSFVKVSVFFIVYDVTKRQTFQKIEQCVQCIFKYNEQKNRYICLVGNKTDLNDRVVSTQQGKSFAQKYKINFVQISAKDPQQVNQTIQTTLKFIHDHNK